MKLVAVTLVALTIPACRGRDAAGSPADRDAVMAASERYRQAWLQGDTATALGLMSDDARILISGIPDIQGADGVRAMFVDEMATYRVPTLTLNHQDLVVRGDHAIDIGTYDEIQVPKTGAPIHGAGRFMTIWRRDADGWKIWRYMLNDLPPQATKRAAP
jgi:ketosteroid isomerase-like protein